MNRVKEKLGLEDIAFFKMCIALLALIVTSLSISSTGDIVRWISVFGISIPFLPLMSLYKVPEVFAYLSFAFLHAFTLQERYKECKTLNIMADGLLFFALYKLVLLPACGFGFFEWIILCLVFLFEFGIMAQKKRVKLPKKKGVAGIDSLLLLGFFLLLFKMLVRYMFKTNLSPDILENDTAMNMITILIVILAVYGFKSAITALKLTKETCYKKSID